MNTTQNHLSISDISDDILLLKDGGAALVMQVSAVNFGLLSGKEQMAIIFSFAQMLNSLSFCIQIVIHSKRLNLTSYLALLDKAYEAQTNPLLAAMMTDYKQFIQNTIKENEVLDKTFYIVIPLFKLELGLIAAKPILEQKIKTILLPRKDQVVRQLNRIGLKAVQPTKQKLVEVFYDIYNGEPVETPAGQTVIPAQIAIRLKNPVIQSFTSGESPSTGSTPLTTSSLGTEKPTPEVFPPAPVQSAPAGAPIASQPSRTHPFVVEEID